MRLSVSGLLGAAALGLCVSAPARAQSVSITIGEPRSIAIGEPYGYRPPPRPVYREHHREFVPVYREHHREFVPVYRQRRASPVYVRPVYSTGSFGPSRCVIRTTRYWDGYGFVERSRRICR